MTHPTARYGVLILFKYIGNDEIVFPENAVAGFIALGYLCHKYIIWYFYPKFRAPKTQWKLAKTQEIQLNLNTKNFR